MKQVKYITLLKLATIVLVALTPLFVIMDTHRLGYVAMNGAWFTWAIPALLVYELEHE